MLNSNLSDLKKINITNVSSSDAFLMTDYSYCYFKNGICYLQLYITKVKAYSGWIKVAELPILLDTDGIDIYFPINDTSAAKGHYMGRINSKGETMIHVYYAKDSTYIANIAFPCQLKQ